MKKQGGTISCMLFFYLLCISAWGATDQGLAGFWKFDEDQGNVVFDFSGNQFNGTLFGANRTNGILEGAVEFDGIDDYISITDLSGTPDLIGDLTVGTISVWFKFDTSPPDDTIHPILYLGDGIGGSSHSGLILEIGHFTSGNDKLYFTILDDNAHIPLCFDSGYDLQVNTWYHFAAVVGPDFNTGYLDGQEMTDRHYNFGNASTSAFFANIQDKQVFWLGKGFLGSRAHDNFHDGMIDEVRIYDRPLSTEEIRTLTLTSGSCFEVNMDLCNPVNLGDLKVFASEWLGNGSLLSDFNGDSQVTILDLITLTEYWLSYCNKVRYQHFSDEDFTSLFSLQLIHTVNLQGSWAFDSILIEGGVIVPQTDLYQIRLNFRPHGELTFDDQLIDSPLGPAGSCSNVQGNSTTGLLLLEQGRFYPFTIRYRSGCSAHPDALRLLWKRNGDASFLPIPAEHLHLPTE